MKYLDCYGNNRYGVMKNNCLYVYNENKEDNFILVPQGFMNGREMFVVSNKNINYYRYKNVLYKDNFMRKFNRFFGVTDEIHHTNSIKKKLIHFMMLIIMSFFLFLLSIIITYIIGN